MLRQIFDTNEVPAAERLDAWYDVMNRFMTTYEYSIADASHFEGSLRGADMGPIQLAAMTYSSLKMRRTAKHIRQSDPGGHRVALVLRGRQGIVQGRQEASLRARDLLVYSDSLPYESMADTARGTAAAVVLQIPRASLPLPARRVERLLATPLKCEQGTARLLSGMLRLVVTDTGPHCPQDNQRLGAVLLDLVTLWLAGCIDAVDRTPAESRQRVLMLQVQGFIRDHLGDPRLTPGHIAAAHHLSLRSLHRLFQSEGTTVAAYVRHQRLSRAAADLADPRLTGRTVHAIAARWGFPRPADFSRAFRAAYAMPPTDYRQLFPRQT